MKLKLEEDGEIVPYIEFEVKTLNSAKLEMFNEWSYIGVTAPTGATYGNYIEENK